MMTRLFVYLAVPFAVACANDGSSPDGQAVTLTLRDPGGATTSNADFVAFRDGDGDWQELTGVDGVYVGDAFSSRYGFWIGCVRSTGSGRDSVLYRAIDDTTELTAGSCAVTELPLTISGALAGLGPDDSTEVYSLLSADFSGDGAYAVGADTGHAELLASRLDIDFNPTSVIRLDLGNITADTVRDLDFAQEGQPPVLVPLTVTNTQPEDLSFDSLTGIYSGDGSMYLPFTTVALGATAVLALPSAMRLPGDVIDTTIFASRQIGSTSLFDRRSAGVFDAQIPATLALPDPISFGDATIGAPFSISWTLPALALAEGDEISSLIFSRSTDDKSVIVTIDASRGWLAEATDLDVPAPANLPVALAPVTGISWSVDYVAGDIMSVWSAAGTSGAQVEKRTQRGSVQLRRTEQLRRR